MASPSSVLLITLVVVALVLTSTTAKPSPKQNFVGNPVFVSSNGYSFIGDSSSSSFRGKADENGYVEITGRKKRHVNQYLQMALNDENNEEVLHREERSDSTSTGTSASSSMEK